MTFDPKLSLRGCPALVTGGAGFLGSHLVQRLVAAGAQVTVVDCLRPDHGGRRWNLRGVADAVELIEADVVEWAVDRNRKPASFDVVFHLAGQVGHGFSNKEPRRDLHDNLATTHALIEMVQSHGSVGRLVLASTRQVYGRPRYLPVDEAHPTDPPDVNGIHKRAAEQAVALASHRGLFDYCVIRLANCYGPHQAIQSPLNGVIGWFLNRGLQGEPIEVFGRGDQSRDVTHGVDASRAILLAGIHTGCRNQCFNLGGEVASIAQIAHYIGDISGSPVVHRDMAADVRSIEVGDLVVDDRRFRSETGWFPGIPLRDGIAATFEHMRAHRDVYL